MGQTQKPANRNKTLNQKKRKDTTVADLISNLPALADVPSMRKELKDIERFGEKQRNPNVKQSMLRSTEIGLNIIQKYNAQNKQLEPLKKNEPIYQQLLSEYQDTLKSSETLISHLDGLVSQLNTENEVLKALLKSHNIPLPEEKATLAPKPNANKPKGGQQKKNPQNQKQNEDKAPQNQPNGKKNKPPAKKKKKKKKKKNPQKKKKKKKKKKKS